MKIYLIYSFLFLFVWDSPTLKDTSRQEAQAETGRTPTVQKSSQIPRHIKTYPLKNSKRTYRRQQYFKPTDGDSPGGAAAFTIGLTWITLGWWALAGSPGLSALLILNFVGVLLAYLFISGSIKPPRIRPARTVVGAVVGAVARAAATAATGCALAVLSILALIVLVVSSVIILSEGWVALLVLGIIAFVGGLIALWSD